MASHYPFPAVQTLLKSHLRMTMVGRMPFHLVISDEIRTAEITATAAADIVHDFLSMFMSSEPPKPTNLPGTWLRDEL